MRNIVPNGILQTTGKQLSLCLSIFTPQLGWNDAVCQVDPSTRACLPAVEPLKSSGSDVATVTEPFPVAAPYCLFPVTQWVGVMDLEDDPLPGIVFWNLSLIMMQIMKPCGSVTEATWLSIVSKELALLLGIT